MTSPRFWKILLQLLPDILAVAATGVVFVVASVTEIGIDRVVQTTCGVLLLFSVSLLVVRATMLLKVDHSLARIESTLDQGGPVQSAVAEQRRSFDQLVDFLTNGALDRKLLDAATTANGYLHHFERVGVVGAYSTLSEVDLATETRLAKKSIRIIASWTGCLISLGDTLVEKARADCDIRILILRHNSEFARLRGLELDPSDEQGATRQIATEMCEFNRLFHQHPDVRTRVRVKAFDARPTMCMFAHDDVRLIGSLWPGINAMDGPVARVVGDGDPFLTTSLGIIADREFERLWHDVRTLYITVVDGDPQYTELAEMAWSTKDQEFISILEIIEQAVREDRDGGRRRALQEIKSAPEKIHIAVLELHEMLRSTRDAEASMIVKVLEDIGELAQAETVLREAVNCGYVQYLEKLVELQFRSGRHRDAERTLRRAVSTGNYYAIFRLIKWLDATDRSREIERVLQEGADAGSPEALTNLVELLDLGNRSYEADRLLRAKAYEGVQTAKSLLAIREFTVGHTT